jgi:hypothetical protein
MEKRLTDAEFVRRQLQAEANLRKTSLEKIGKDLATLAAGRTHLLAEIEAFEEAISRLAD